MFAEKAAIALNGAMLKYGKELGKKLKGIKKYDTKTIGPIAGELYDKVIDPIHREYKRIGANDTPVREVSILGAIDMVKKRYSKTRFTRLGDYIG